ncbi:alkaline phosphatase family protein [Actinoplanes sp. KI2]|uniref:alkaline phosphatase family protein n=1 Tax=Actinoplanes sp. KI2 TaxID=2983315 RepID=UPI0021D5D0C8|nr:alkaline phosphatase family protein [Actinoplanes sp. KI2]MCU7723886.1 alkaline phosphatase family protein [Actinoplanes sp. KI2]
MKPCAAAIVVAAVVVTTAWELGPPEPTPSAGVSAPAPETGRKVMVIAEENHGYHDIIGDPHAPYLNRLAARYGIATNYDAGYPARCPSLAAYILMTSGTTAGICDDKDPKFHPLTGDNVFHQLSAAGRQWRAYAESSPGGCALRSKHTYLVRHVPPTYFRDTRADCRRWAVPLGTPTGGALHHDVVNGVLPAYAFVSPNACHDMHGAPSCPTELTAAGDHWLRTWLPHIVAGPDYRAGRLTIIITWDEGTSTSNHIPTIVVAPSVKHVRTAQRLTHCSTLRFTEEQLRLPLLRCAAGATSLASAFGIRRRPRGALAR